MNFKSELLGIYSIRNCRSNNFGATVNMVSSMIISNGISSTANIVSKINRSISISISNRIWLSINTTNCPVIYNTVSAVCKRI